MKGGGMGGGSSIPNAQRDLRKQFGKSTVVTGLIFIQKKEHYAGGVFKNSFKRVGQNVKSNFLICHILEENKINKNFKIGEKLQAKHHKKNQKIWKFDRFFWCLVCILFSILKWIFFITNKFGKCVIAFAVQCAMTKKQV